MEAARVVALRQRRTGALTTDDASLSAREQTLAALARRLGSLLSRRPGLALGLWGEAGIGKTHAARELLRGLSARSVTIHATLPFGAVLRALPPPRRPGVWLERALEQVQAGQELAPDSEVLTLAGLLAASAPFVLHVEDLHEADESRAALWRGLAAAVMRLRGVGLLVTSRVQPPSPFEVTRLTPLDRPGSDALMEAEARASLPPEALEWLWRRAAGHPLFALEYFRLLARRGLLWNDGRAWRWRPPPATLLPLAVEALVERVLRDACADLSERVAVLEARALLPDGADEALWVATCGLAEPTWRSAWAALEHAGVLVGGDLAHPLYRELTLHTLPRERREAHARRALAHLTDDPQRAAPFAQLAGLAPHETLTWLLQAAEAARLAGQELQAARFEAAAVDHATGEERQRLAYAAARSLRRVDQLAALRLAERALGPALQQAEVLGFLARSLASRGDLSGALARLEAAPPDVQGGPALRVILHALAGDLAGAVRLWHADEEVQRSADPELLGQAAYALSGVGQQAEAWALLERALVLPDLSPERRCKLVQVCAAVCYREGQYVRQEALTAEALTLARAGGMSLDVANTLYNRARALAMLGQYPEALGALEEARQRYAEVGDARNYASVQVFAADLLLNVAGDFERAEDLLLESRELWQQLELTDQLTECESVLSDLYSSWTLPHARVLALKHAEAALAAGEAQGAAALGRLSGLLCLSRAETGLGRAPRGLEYALEAVQLAARHHHPWAHMTALTRQADALDALGRSDEALRCYTEAHQRATELQLVTEQHLLGLELARLRADPAEVSAHLAYFAAQGLRPAAERARGYLAGLAAVPVAQAAPAGPRLELLGELRCSDGASPRPVRGRRRQELLALLAEARLAGRTEVARTDLLDLLYSGVPEAQAGAALRELVYQVRADLGAGTVLTTPQGYALGELALDAAEFLAGGDTRLWRGPYLGGLAGREEGVREALHLALRARAEALIASDPSEAARLGRLWLEADPYDHAALRLTLQALRAGGNHRGLGREYARARSRFAELGETLPEGWTEFLASPEVVPT